MFIVKDEVKDVGLLALAVALCSFLCDFSSHHNYNITADAFGFLVILFFVFILNILFILINKGDE